MKAITVKQPWAFAIATGAKTVENRGRAVPWTSAVGERIAIHAGKGWDDDAAYDDRIAEEHGRRLGFDVAVSPMRNPEYFDFGAVVATAVLVDVHYAERIGTRLCSPWAEDGQFHLVLRDLGVLSEPAPCRGFQGLWSLPEDVEQLVLSRSEVAA